MPLLQTTQLNASSHLGIWRVDETIEDLTSQLLALRPGHELPAFKAESRTREWLAARVLAYRLLEKLTPELVVVTRHETGQPLCSAGNLQVSLTHSGPWVAALVSGSNRVGIDIELKGSKVARLVNKFLNDAELAAAAHDPEKMHLYWSAKETLYKIYSHKKLLFKENLLLQYFEKKSAGQFIGQVRTQNIAQCYDVQYEITGAYVLTYVLAPLLPQE